MNLPDLPALASHGAAIGIIIGMCTSLPEENFPGFKILLDSG